MALVRVCFRLIRSRFALIATLAAALLVSAPSRADKGGISFWLPGSFGSLAATPGQPGWALATIYMHTNVRAGGDVAASRAIRFGNRTANLTVNLDARLKAQVDLIGIAPSYTFAEPVLGGQPAVSMLGFAAHSQATIDAAGLRRKSRQNQSSESKPEDGRASRAA